MGLFDFLNKGKKGVNTGETNENTGKANARSTTTHFYLFILL